MPKPKTTRLVELDALRGLAALAVVLYHFTWRYDELFAARDGLWLRISWGDRGVLFFFILSGFVISLTMERTATARDFVFGRFSRLYPAFWGSAALTLCVVTLIGLPGQEVSPRDAVLNATMIPSALGAGSIDGAYWSLQAEIFFYAAVLTLWSIGLWKRLPLVICGWLLLAVMVQTLLNQPEFLPHAVNGMLAKASTLLNLAYISLFGLGMTLYQVYSQRRLSFTWGTTLVACLVAHGLMHGAAEALITAALAGIFALTVWGWLPWLACRPLAFLGGLSYTLYLVHQNVGYCVIRGLDGRGLNPNLSIALALGASLLLAVAISYTVERPALAWLRQWYRGAKQPALVLPAASVEAV